MYFQNKQFASKITIIFVHSALILQSSTKNMSVVCVVVLKFTILWLLMTTGTGLAADMCHVFLGTVFILITTTAISPYIYYKGSS